MKKVEIVDRWENFPVENEAYTIGRDSESGRWFFTWGSEWPRKLTRFGDGVPEDGWYVPANLKEPLAHSGIEWFDTEEEALRAREGAIKCFDTVSNRNLVPGMDVDVVIYTTENRGDRATLTLRIPRAGTLYLTVDPEGIFLQGNLDHAYLYSLGERYVCGPAHTIYEDVAAALAEAVEESGFPLPGELKWELSDYGIRWVGDFTGGIDRESVSLDLENPLWEVVTTKEAAQEWGVADATIRQYILEGKFRPDEVRKSGGTWLIKRGALWRVFGVPKK